MTRQLKVRVVPVHSPNEVVKNGFCGCVADGKAGAMRRECIKKIVNNSARPGRKTRARATNAWSELKKSINDDKRFDFMER
jgi:hypothetical protein